MTDNDIIRGIRENSEAAWRELFAMTHSQFAPKISAMLIMSVATTYEDIYEQACMDLMANVKDGKLTEGENINLPGYLYTICWRRALRAEESHKVKEKRMVKMAKEEAKDEASDEFSPDVVMEFDPEGDEDAKNKALVFLEKVLAAIPESCRQLFRRFYWDKMPMKDIAAAMGLKNDDVAKATKSKCMKKYKDIAKAMLADDEKADEAVRRVVERDALRDLLEECRNEASGEWAIAALKEKDTE